MNDVSPQLRQSRIGSVLVALFFVFTGCLVLFDTLSYSDIDSKVFPRAAAIVLIVASLISLLFAVRRETPGEGFGRGSWVRRVILVVSMLAACVAMPSLGFLSASVIVFIGAMLAAMHDAWSIKNSIVYLLAGAVVLVGFYSLFKFALHVPLP